MVAVDTGTDVSSLVDIVVSGNLDQIIATAREYLQRDTAVDILIGRIAMITAHGDLTGHRTITLAAASMLSRLIHWIPAPIDTPDPAKDRALPLLVQALKIARPILAAGREALAHISVSTTILPQ